MGLRNYFNRHSGFFKIASSIGGGSVSILALIIGYFQYLQQSGGDLALQFNGRTVSSSVTKNIAICIDSANTAYNFSSIYPIFYNPKKYSVHDFMLQYHVSSSDILFEPVEQYSLSSEGEGRYILRYNHDKLAPYESSVIPIKKFIIPNNGGRIDINVQASFDGADSMKRYKVAARFLIVPNQQTDDFDKWKAKCQRECNRTMNEADYDAYFVSSRFHSQDYQYNYALTATKATAEVQNPPKKTNVRSRQGEHQQQEAKTQQNPQPPADAAITARPSNLDQYFESIRTDEYTSSDGITRYAGLKFKFREEYENDTVYVFLLTEDTVRHSLHNRIWEIRRHSIYSNELSYLVPQNEIIKGYDLCTIADSLASRIKISEDYKVKNKHNEPVALLVNRIKNNSVETYYEIIAPKSEKTLWQNDSIKIAAGSIRYLKIPQTYITDDLKPKKFTDDLWLFILSCLGFWILMVVAFPICSRIEEAFDAFKYSWSYAKTVLLDKDKYLEELKDFTLIGGFICLLALIGTLIVHAIVWFA